MIDINRYNTDTTMKRQVLHTIYQKRKVSRGELTEILELSPTSVTKYVGVLLDEGIIVECGALESPLGRKTTLLGINPDYAFVLGIDIGRYAVKTGVIHMDGTIAEDWFIPIQKEYSTDISFAPQDLYNEIDKILNKYGKDRFIAICVGISGMVDHMTGKVVFCPNLPAWNDLSLGEILHNRFNLPIFIDTSARCMALAEWKYGNGIGIPNQLFVSLGNYSIASALIIDSKLYRGSNGFSGEIGHITGTQTGIRCSCGNYDCLELSATLMMIRKNIFNRIIDFQGFSPLRKLLPEQFKKSDITAQIIKQSIDAGDKLCYEIVVAAGIDVGIALANLLNVFNPKIVILGGSVIEFFPSIIDTIQKTIRERVLVPIQQNVEVCQAKMDWRGAVVGSSELLFMTFFNNMTI